MPSPKQSTATSKVAPKMRRDPISVIWSVFWPRSLLGRVLICILIPVVMLLVNLAVTAWPFAFGSDDPFSFEPDAYSEQSESGISRSAAELPIQSLELRQANAVSQELRHEAGSHAGGTSLRKAEHRAASENGKVIRIAETVWAIKQGSLEIKVDLGTDVETVKGDPDNVLNMGKDCWSYCSTPGLCDWCGTGNACCRRNHDSDPPECRNAQGFRTGHHECVSVSSIVHRNAKVIVSHDGKALLSSPLKGVWSVGRDLNKGWPRTWDYGGIEVIDVVGPWLVIEGSVKTSDGKWIVKDRWRIFDGVVEGLRTWSWAGHKPSSPSVLSVGWQTAGGKGNGLMMPGVSYYGNPSGQKALRSGWALVPSWNGKEDEKLQVEEHRLAQTWASFEWEKSASNRVVVALESQPSSPPYGQHPDLTWSLGAEMLKEGTLLQALSGPVALNGQTGKVKSGQNRKSAYVDVGLKVPPGKVVQKRYRVHVGGPVSEGAGFRIPLDWIIARSDLSADSLPRFADIVQSKVRFAMSRWAGKNQHPGFAMYPGNMNVYVMGWAGQAEAPGYALQVLADRLGQPELKEVARKALDELAKASFNEEGFKLQLDGRSGKWSQQDPISQGQAMTKFAHSIRYGQKTGINTQSWEKFLKRACSIHAERFLDERWRPRSTAEAFIIQPLALAAKMFGEERFLKAALKAGDHYFKRHIGLKEPFWGGTLDASCEDKEGVWAGFEAFLALHEATGDAKWLDAANYAADMVLTYTYLWDVPMPPGRLRDHDLKTRGWTAVSVQNMHLDVYGVLYTPRLWRLGELANRPSLFRMAELMYRSCGQMIDAHGSQGEQLQQTRFAQAGDQSNPDEFRGGYVESWTVFWIAAHFLTAAAEFEEMGVLSDLWERV